MRNTSSTKPMLGWNSFDSFGASLDEKYFYQNLEVFEEKLKPAGYEYFVIDILWYEDVSNRPKNKHGLIIGRRDNENRKFHMDEWGRFTPSKEYFPNGFTPLIEKVHEKGLKFGVHLMRGVPRAACENKLPILGTDGITADMIACYDPSDFCPWSTINYGIDMTKPGAQEYYDSVVLQLAEVGVDFIKYDDIERNADEMQAIYKAIEKVDREITLSLSLGSYHYMKEQLPLETYSQSNMMRITHDIWDKRDDLIDAFDGWVQRSIQDKQRPSWFFFDLDMIPFGRLRMQKSDDTDENPELVSTEVEHDCLLNDAQKRTFITQRALAASPLFMGGHLPLTSEYELNLMTDKDMLECNQNAVTGHPVRRKGSFHIFRTPSKECGDNYGWIGVFNITTASDSISLDSNFLGLNRQKKYKLFDIWNKKDLVLENGKINISLEGDDVLFIKYELDK